MRQRLRVDTRPEQRVVADMAMAFTAAIVVRGRLRFVNHRRHFCEPAALLVAESPERLARNEPGQQAGHITDQSRISNAQLGYKGVFGEAAEETMKWMGFRNLARHKRTLLTDLSSVDTRRPRSGSTTNPLCKSYA